MRRGAVAWLLALTLITPLLTLLAWAGTGRWPYPSLLPSDGSLRGARLLADPQSGVLSGLATSASIGVAVTGLAMLVGVPAGRALGVYAFRGRRVVQVLLLAPAVVPPLAVLLGTHVVFLRLGLADSIAGVVLVQLVPAVPYVTVVMAGAFARYDVGHEDQARMLGAGAVRTAVSVTLPALRSSLAAAALLAFLISWSEYVLTLLIGGGVVRTLPLLLFAHLRTADYTEAAAVAVLLAAPPLVAIAALARGIAGGHAYSSGAQPAVGRP